MSKNHSILLRKCFFILYIAALIFTRFWNIEKTARFSEDESGFLVRVHQLYVERKLTLVGQVNEQGTKVFSSLSAYLLMPFAILGKFDPASVFYGAAFFGVVTAVVMLHLAKTVNRKQLIISSLVVLFWYPLVQLGRWSWNPNFIPLWISLGILCYFQKKDIFYLFSGIFLGLSIHQHYYSIFAVSAFSLFVTFEMLRKRHYKKAFLINMGIVLTLLPFVIFDLRHPPGIFLLGASNQAQILKFSQISRNILRFTSDTLNYFTQSGILSILLSLTLVVTLVTDISAKNKSLFFLFPAVTQIVLISSLGVYYGQYFFPVIPFLFIFLVYPRKGTGKLFSLISLVTLIVGGVLAIYPYLSRSSVIPDLSTVKKIDNILENRIAENDLKNINIAVLGSPDVNTYGQKYRDLLLVPNNINIMSHNEYFTNDFLFVISTEGETDVRHDPAIEIQNFRNGRLMDKWEIDSGPWVIYLFARGT